MKCFVYFLAEIPVTECELCHDPLPICSRRVTCKNNNGLLNLPKVNPNTCAVFETMSFAKINIMYLLFNLYKAFKKKKNKD